MIGRIIYGALWAAVAVVVLVAMGAIKPTQIPEGFWREVATIAADGVAAAVGWLVSFLPSDAQATLGSLTATATATLAAVPVLVVIVIMSVYFLNSRKR